MVEHRCPVSIYYEDTDFSGMVYHANYLKFFERAREHLLGRARLVELWRTSGWGFVVYRAELQFKEPAVFGDELEIVTRADVKSDYRVEFSQNAWKVGGTQPIVEGKITLVCVNRDGKLVRLPEEVVAMTRPG